jgi:hypothetical protein
MSSTLHHEHYQYFLQVFTASIKHCPPFASFASVTAVKASPTPASAKAHDGVSFRVVSTVAIGLEFCFVFVIE